MEPVFLREVISGAEGEGAEVSRLFPIRGFMNFDPFVLWDHFKVPPDAGFPDHPHRGFEGITYVFEGAMQHKDNLGNQSTVEQGGLQRFTAGKGLVHSEMPSPNQVTSGIQMWVNLSRKQKKLDPDYQQVNANEVPQLQFEGGTVRVLIGEGSPLKVVTPTRFLDIQFETSGVYEETLPSSFRGFIYVVHGSVITEQYTVNQGSALFFDKADKLTIKSNGQGRVMACFGQPHGEPIYQRGPYVD